MTAVDDANRVALETELAFVRQQPDVDKDREKAIVASLKVLGVDGKPVEVETAEPAKAETAVPKKRARK